MEILDLASNRPQIETLLFDDDKAVLRLTADVVQEMGFKVTVAGSVEKALSLLDSRVFDLIITDIFTNGIQRIDILEKVKRENPLAAVIILTEHCSFKTAITGLRYHADDFTLKPFTKPELQHRIRTVLQRQTLQRRLLKTQEMAMVGHFAGGIAHNFNNLLTGAMGYASLIKTMVDKESEIYRYGEQIENTMNSISLLVNQLSAYARVGKRVNESISINDIINNLTESFKGRISSEIKIILQLAPDIYPLKGYSVQIHQALHNILINAVEAISPTGEIIVSSYNETLNQKKFRNIEISPGEYIHITVGDNGEGMDPSLLKHIFEPFVSTKGFGRGLGLAAAYGIVKNHGGYILFRNNIDRGTDVDIYFPADGNRLS